MIRLHAPHQEYRSTLEDCIDSINGNNGLKGKVSASVPALLQAAQEYIDSAKHGELYRLVPIDTRKIKNPVVLGSLFKKELLNLYEYYFRDKRKGVRRVYDQLLNAAHEKCPFCGGLGTPRNIDHFLPKAHFPQFVIFPHNLVPSCRDCNMDGKSDNLWKRAEVQPLQPYLDDDRFFLDQWIFGEYVTISPGLPGAIRYYVDPPEHWAKVHKDRVHQHFFDFSLAKRYSVKAAEALSITQKQIEALRRRGACDSIICEDLLAPAIDAVPFVNHWQRGMFQALYDTLVVQ